MKTPLLPLLAAVGLLLPTAAEAAQQFPLLQRAASCDVVKDRLADVIADLAYQRSLYRYRYRYRHDRRFGGMPVPKASARRSATSADAAGKSARESAPQATDPAAPRTSRAPTIRSTASTRPIASRPTGASSTPSRAARC